MTYRVMQKFWLDLEKPDEEEINQFIDHYKRQRQFTRIIRDGIRLMWSLEQGNLDVLFELFPSVMDEFYQRALASHTPQDKVLAEHISRLERLLLEQGSIPIPSTTGAKPLVAPQIAPPMLDDADELLSIKKAKSDSTSARNFLDAAFGLVQ